MSSHNCVVARPRAARAALASRLFPLGALIVLAPSAAHAVVSNSVARDSLVPITVRFQAVVGSEAFACGASYQNIGSSKATITASEFRFYVHDIRLINAKGDTVRAAIRPESPWQDSDVALLDFENGAATCSNGTPETRDAVVVMAPAGTYRGVAFTLGVPFSRNHLDVSQAPPPLSLSRLFWSWTGGYKFLRVDMRATSGDSAATPWVIHLGSTGCTPAATATTPVATCSHPNRATVALNAFDPAKDVVTADLAALLARSDVRTNQPKTASGCMSADNDADCGGLFAALGLPHSSSTGADSPKFFRVSRAGGTRVGARP